LSRILEVALLCYHFHTFVLKPSQVNKLNLSNLSAAMVETVSPFPAVSINAAYGFLSLAFAMCLAH
jgi:hypothetical protein